MRYITAVVMSFAMSFTVMAELGPKEQKLADMLLSGDMNQLKAASKDIYSAEISDPELLDISAEILLKKYPRATRLDVDTLAWVARSIGASENGRYYGVLSEVVESTDINKLERHAEKALDDLPGAGGEQYIAGMYPLPEGLYSEEPKADVIVRLKEKMLDGELGSLKQVAQEMAAKELKSEILCDIAAEILLTNYATAQKNQLDTFAWLTNAIGSSGMAQYRDTLSEIEKNAGARKLRRYAEKNLDRLPEVTVEQYQQGMFDEPLPNYLF